MQQHNEHLTTLVSVINSLNNFANVTISSLYFDITKDCLYADQAHSLERRRVVTVLEQVCYDTFA
jgi:isoleucyl-tRNA synthetase